MEETLCPHLMGRQIPRGDLVSFCTTIVLPPPVPRFFHIGLWGSGCPHPQLCCALVSVFTTILVTLAPVGFVHVSVKLSFSRAL